MRDKSHIYLLATVGILLVSFGCDNGITEIEKKESYIDAFPEFGETPLPDFYQTEYQPKNRKKRRGKGDMYDRATMKWMKNYLAADTGTVSVAISGHWFAEKEKYKYDIHQLDFPKSIVQESAGKMGYYTYYLKNSSGKTVRELVAYIPATEGAKLLMEQWLEAGKRKAESDQQNNKRREIQKSKMSDLPCEHKTPEGTCWVWYPETGWGYGSCGTAMVCGKRPTDCTSPNCKWPPSNNGGGWDWAKNGYDDGGDGNGTGGSNSGSDSFQGKLMLRTLKTTLRQIVSTRN